MLNVEASRRVFIRNTALGAGAVLAGCRGGGDGGGAVAVVQGTTAGVVPGYRPDPVEVARWQKAIGQSFMITGAEGTLSARLDSVAAQETADNRPSYLRQETFTAFFSTDERFDPAGDRIYLANSAAMGARQIFLSRGADQGGRSVLMALFG